MTQWTANLVFDNADALDEALTRHLLADRTSVAVAGRQEVWEAFAGEDGDVWARRVDDHENPDTEPDVITVPVWKIPAEEFPAAVWPGGRVADEVLSKLVADAVYEVAPRHLASAALAHTCQEDWNHAANAVAAAVVGNIGGQL